MHPQKVLITDASCVTGYGAFRTMYQDKTDLDFVLFLSDLPENRNLFDKFKTDVRVRMIWDDPADEITVKDAVDSSNYVLFVNDKGTEGTEQTTPSINVQQIIKLLEQKPDIYQTQIFYIGEKPKINPLIAVTPYDMSSLHKQSTTYMNDQSDPGFTIDIKLKPLEKEERIVNKKKEKKKAHYGSWVVLSIFIIVTVVLLAKFMNNMCIYCFDGDRE